MALREIVKIGDNVLRKKCREISEITEKTIELLDDMAETMHHEGRGIGLAAPQVGVLRRVFVVDIGDEAGLIEFINPVITQTDGQMMSQEGCLSLPGESGMVYRPKELEIQALNRFGETFTLRAEGLQAICISHEFDHLEGVLFVDKLIPESELPVQTEDDEE